MEKPALFFSHSARDSRPLAALKDRFCEGTGGAIDVFLSSDGQSIPFGRNWVFEVEEALNRAALMFAFLSQASIGSGWVHFEAGHAYARGIEVVPVGMPDLDLADLKPPLSLLQGFNIHSFTALNNIVQVANRKFRHTHLPFFTETDYLTIFAPYSGVANSSLGQFSELVDALTLRLPLDPPVEPDRVQAELTSRGLSTQVRGSSVVAHGLVIKFQNDGHIISCSIDPGLTAVTLPVIDGLLETIPVQTDPGPKLLLWLVPTVRRCPDLQRLTARLYGTPIHLGEGSTFCMGDLIFSFDAGYRERGPARYYIEFHTPLPRLEEADLAALLETLFESEALEILDEVAIPPTMG